jgi:uncharacterized membrane protein YkoI
MKQTSLILAVIICLLFASFSVSSNEKVKATPSIKECQLISSKTAMTRAQKKTGGKVVSVKLDKKGKDYVYRVRLLVGEKRIKNISIKACK